MIDWERLNTILDGLPFKLNEQQQDFITHFIQRGEGNSVLSGVAGAGKSLMMWILKKYYNDEIVFFGSTGVSSQNLPDGIGMGTTHSYLSLPTKPSTKYNHTKVSPKCSNLFGKSDLVKIIVIDESYIHNSDNLDMIWRRIERFNKPSKKRKKRKIRLLLVGDSCQAVTIADRSLKSELKIRWGSHLMFRSEVWDRFNFTHYVLDKVERQDDKVFKACLDVIRYNQVSRLPKCLSWLNQRVVRDYGTDRTVLAATNKTVDRINKQVLDKNPNPKYHFQPQIEKVFDMKDTLMRPEGVTLCKDLKVMTIVNDQENRWINGSIGYVTMVTSEGCYVRFSHSGEEHFVPLYTWENKAFETWEDVGEDGVVVSKMKELVLGKMTCIQLLPASCISISKSQGLTITEEYVIDVESPNLYTSPQLEDFGTNFVYLALSRGVDISKIFLARPIEEGHIKCCTESIKYWFECKQNSVI